MDALRELGYLIYGWLVDVSAEPGFWPGVLMGVAGFALTAYMMFMVRVWWGNVTAPYRPQRVTHVTDATPAQVTSKSLRALVLGLLIFTCVVCGLIEILLPGGLQGVLRALGWEG